MVRGALRRWLRRLHLWLALTIGVPAAVAGLSGSLLVFGDGLDRLLAPELRSVQATGPAAIEPAVQAAAASLPTQPVRYIQLPRRSDDSLVCWLGDDDHQLVYVDPFDASVLGTRAHDGGLVGLMHEIHVHLLMGEAGTVIAGVVGLLVAAEVCLGMVLWWPGRKRIPQALRIRLRRGWRLANRDLHVAGGALTSPLLLLALLSGAALAFYAPTARALVATLGGPAYTGAPPLAEPAGDDQRLPLDRLISAAEQEIPGASATWIYPATDSQSATVVRLRLPANPHPNGNSYIALHPDTAAVVDVHRWDQASLGQQAADTLYPLHIGTVGGTVTRVLAALTGLLPLGLLIGGVVMWRQRSLATASAKTDRAPRNDAGP